VRCFDALSAYPSAEHSYPMIGWYSFSHFGYALISVGIVAELFGALCTNTIFLWRNVSFLLPSLSASSLALLCSVVSLPTCWMLNFSQLSVNSLLGCVCKVFTAVVVVLTFALNVDADVASNVKNHQIDVLPRSTSSFCISIGIYIMSFSGHPCLPSIHRAMRKPEEFERMLDVCFVVMACSYTLLSVCGYLTFAGDTNVIITANLLTQNPFLSRTLIVLVVLRCYFQVSPLIAVMAEIPESALFGKEENATKIRVFRTVLFLFMCAVSFLCMDILPSSRR